MSEITKLGTFTMLAQETSILKHLHVRLNITESIEEEWVKLVEIESGVKTKVEDYCINDLVSCALKERMMMAMFVKTIYDDYLIEEFWHWIPVLVISYPTGFDTYYVNIWKKSPKLGTMCMIRYRNFQQPRMYDVDKSCEWIMQKQKEYPQYFIVPQYKYGYVIIVRCMNKPEKELPVVD